MNFKKGVNQKSRRNFKKTKELKISVSGTKQRRHEITRTIKNRRKACSYRHTKSFWYDWC